MGGSRDSFHFRPPSPPTLYDSAKAQSSAHTPTPVCVLPSALVVRPLFLIPPLSLFRLYIFFVCDGGGRERERGRGLSSTVRRRSWSEPTTLSPSSSSSTKGRKRHLKLYVYFSPFFFFSSSLAEEAKMTQVFIVTSWQPRYLITTTGQSPSPLGRTQRTGRASHRPWGNGSTRQDRKREKEEKTNSSPPPPPPPPAAMTIHWGASFRPPFSPQPPTHVRRCCCCCHRPLGFLRERERETVVLSLSAPSLFVNIRVLFGRPPLEI